MPRAALRKGRQSTQMNIRIDAGLKAAGDAVLKRSGVSPSQFIRTAYQHIVDVGYVDLSALTNPSEPPASNKDSFEDHAGYASTLYEHITGIALEPADEDAPSLQELLDVPYADRALANEQSAETEVGHE